MGRQDYHWIHEPILYGWIDGKHRWYSDRKQRTIMNFDRPTVNELHPTMKPIELYIYLMNNSSKMDDIVLDLFGGSGNLGFEAISRGARHATFVDNNRASVKIIEETAEQFGISEQIRAVFSAVDSFLSKFPRPYDLVFADPPYDYPAMDEIIERVLSDGWLAPNGWFLLEHDKRHNFSEHPNCVFSKPYGRTIVSIFVLSGEDQEEES